MAAEIKEAFGTEVELVAGSGGVFDVIADGKTIFSRKAAGSKFPAPGQIVAALKTLRQP